MEVAQWVQAGEQAILQLLDQEHAAVWLEVEARIADRRWLPMGVRIDPHHLTTARQQLRRAGKIDETPDVTKGGSEVSVLHLTNLRRRKRAFERAAARKRLLQARYLRWAVGLNLLGPAGEKVALASLVDVAPAAGHKVERSEGGQIATLFGAPVPGGPLDGASHLQISDDNGIPAGVVTLPIEVKNVREWIYPDSERLHQLLYKAARLTELHPGVPITPVLVCRRGQHSTFNMAKAFGFYVADAKAQFVPRRADITPTDVEEVRTGLGFADLRQDEGPARLLRHHFGQALPRAAASAAAAWATHGSKFTTHYERLRQPNLGRLERARLTGELQGAVRELRGEEPTEPEWFGDY